MKNTLISIALKPTGTRSGSWCLHLVILILFLFFYLVGIAQGGSCVDNNTIELKPPVCSDYRILLKGSRPSGGTGSYTYRWEVNANGNCGNNGFVEIPGATGPDYNVPLSADPKSCYRRVVVSGNCSGESNKINTAGQSNLSPVLPTVKITQPTCEKPTGTITVNSPVTAIGFSINGIDYSNTSGVFSDLAPKTYKLTVRYAIGCVSPEVSFTINTPVATPDGSISPANASICATGGTVLLTATGGNSYQWYKDGVLINGATTATYTATAVGKYTADIISGNCKGKASNTAVVTETKAPSAAITPASASLCGNKPVVLTISGGNRYQWYRNGVAINGATAATVTITEPGTYRTDIMGSNGCKGKSSNEVSVTTGDGPVGSISPAAVSICDGGTATLTATGGTAYQWYKDGMLIQGAIQATYTIATPGTYSADIINGVCKSKASNEVVATISNKPTGTIKPSTATICNGGTVLLTTTGGSSYQWFKDGIAINGAKAASYSATSPGQYSVTIYNGNCSGSASNISTVSQSNAITFNNTITNPSCVIPTGTVTINSVSGGSGTRYLYSKDNGMTYQEGNTFSGLNPGQYQIVVKDEGGCKSTAKTVTIKQAANAPKATVVTTDMACGQSNGTATITATGGQPPYTFSLNGNAGQSENVFKNLAEGAYKVLVKDATGCSTEVNFTIKQANSTLSATATVKNPSCGQTTGSVNVTPANGTPNYLYSLNKGTYQANATFENVAIGKHTVTVKDNAGCTFEVAFEIKATGEAPQLVITNPASVCAGATTNLKDIAVTVGSAPGLTLTYWTNADATVALNNPEQASAGTYYIKAVNAEGCSIVKSVVVSSVNTPAGSITPANPALLCNDDSVVLTASNGASYQWYKDDIVIAGATSASFKVTQEGKYTVLIDNGICTSIAGNAVVVRFQACAPGLETKVFVPTAFTPNRNSKNDLLQPYLLNVRQLVQFKVFNRWGQQVYQTNTIGEGWDGTIKGEPQPAETYSWILECVDFDGKLIKQSGRSLLIR